MPQPNTTALGEADGRAALWDFGPFLPAQAFPLPGSVVGWAELVAGGVWGAGIPLKEDLGGLLRAGITTRSR